MIRAWSATTCSSVARSSAALSTDWLSARTRSSMPSRSAIRPCARWSCSASWVASSAESSRARSSAAARSSRAWRSLAAYSSARSSAARTRASSSAWSPVRSSGSGVAGRSPSLRRRGSRCRRSSTGLGSARPISSASEMTLRIAVSSTSARWSASRAALDGLPVGLGRALHQRRHLGRVELGDLLLVPTAPPGDPWLARPVSAALRPGLVVGGRGHVADVTYVTTPLGRKSVAGTARACPARAWANPSPE